MVDDAPIVRYVNLLVLQSLNERASDIHVEPTAENLRIRYRIDGVLHDMSTAPRAIAAAVTTRLKVMADLNIAEHRIPQDGRISLNVGNRQIDLRMATLPTIYGEKVVMRVLDKSNVVLSFEDLGFDADLLEIVHGDLHQALRDDPRHRARPGRARRRRSTPRWPRSTRPRRTSSRSRTRSSSASRASARSSSTSRPASPSPRPCGRSCGPTPTSCSSGRSATGRRR